jgi:hypothetical protein
MYVALLLFQDKSSKLNARKGHSCTTLFERPKCSINVEHDIIGDSRDIWCDLGLFRQLDEVLVRIPNPKIEARGFKHEPFKADDYFRGTFKGLGARSECIRERRCKNNHTIIRTEMFRGGDFDVVSCTYDLSRLLQGILDLAGCE